MYSWCLYRTTIRRSTVRPRLQDAGSCNASSTASSPLAGTATRNQNCHFDTCTYGYSRAVLVRRRDTTSSLLRVSRSGKKNCGLRKALGRELEGRNGSENNNTDIIYKEKKNTFFFSSFKIGLIPSPLFLFSQLFRRWTLQSFLRVYRSGKPSWKPLFNLWRIYSSDSAVHM